MPRFTVRRMMVAIVVVAVGLGAYETWCRWSSHRRLCLEKVAMHEWAGDMFCARIHNNAPAFYPTEAALSWAYRRIDYHDSLAAKYRQAAGRPWRPVAPDPPEPK